MVKKEQDGMGTTSPTI